MNQKTRTVIQNLISVARYSGLSAVGATAAIAAAEKLLNPPVRFAWAKPQFGGEYHASVGAVTYSIRRCSGRPLAWRTVVSIGAEDVKALYFPTLAAAKQACVDYGIAHRKG